MAPPRSRALGDLLNPQPNSNLPAGGSQNPSVKTSLHGLNNHSELRTPQNIPRSSLKRLDRSIVPSTSSQSVGNPGGLRRTPSQAATTSAAKSQANHHHTPPVPIPDTQKRRLVSSPNQSQVLAKRPKPPQSSLGDQHPRADQLDFHNPIPESRDLTEVEVNYLENLTSTGGLDDEHARYARGLAEVAGESNQHLAMCYNVARVHYLQHQTQGQVASVSQQLAKHFHEQDTLISNKINILTETVRDLTEAIQKGLLAKPGPTPDSAASQPIAEKSRTPWAASTELKSLLTAVSVELMPKDNLQVYTAVEDRAKKWLARSLFNSVKIRVSEGDKEWVGRHLPSKIRGVNDGKGLRDYDRAIREACKHSREKLHLLLLTNIIKHKQGKDNKVPVPTLQDLWHRIVIKCGIIADSVESKTAWADADDTTRSRIAYLRREAARLRKNPSSSNIWSDVDRQLDVLRVKDRENPDYSSKFYNFIYQNDREIFNGKRSWFEIRRSYVLTLPDEATILGSPPAALLALDAPNVNENGAEEIENDAEEIENEAKEIENEPEEIKNDAQQYEDDEAEPYEDDYEPYKDDVAEPYEDDVAEEIKGDDGYDIGLHSED